MDDMGKFRRAVTEWAARRAGAAQSAVEAGELAARIGLRTVVLVEGDSDLRALDTLAARRDRNLAAEGVAVLPLGGATNIGHFLSVCGPKGLGVTPVGLCDVGEMGHFQRALEREGFGAAHTRDELESLGYYLCDADLEDELIRALGPAGVEQVIAAEDELRPFRTFQNQPFQRERTIEQQLRRFMGTHSGRKAQYAQAMVESLDLDRTPRPLERLLARV
ncbi:TOPRIM nucleotidyl transferase/hydrolase domain-containing protein [Streptomyces sp. N35]|uniref:TOPRIM nucleotidyl transferase/hydrolase domain-containing protein n=1 Tax=Streptomyces sp. N35 TaxID=2795730 RepID=UPI0018F66DC0|nr:TOPRIM nucleotidyl transferase/hydrolase domain-containing protein [Streptomyces sp. N35]